MLLTKNSRLWKYSNSLRSRVEGFFERQKFGTRQVEQNCFRTPISKFHNPFLLFLLINLAQGLWKCWLTKMGKNNFLFTKKCEACPRAYSMSSLGLLSSKHEEKVKKKSFFFHFKLITFLSNSKDLIILFYQIVFKKSPITVVL